VPFEVWFGQVGEPQNVAQRPARDLAFAEARTERERSGGAVGYGSGGRRLIRPVAPPPRASGWERAVRRTGRPARCARQAAPPAR
jgi:hypothetical protein